MIAVKEIRVVRVGVLLFEDELKKLKEVTGEKVSRDAVRKAVLEYLRMKGEKI